MKKYSIEYTVNVCRNCHFCELEPKNRVACETWLTCKHQRIGGRKIITQYCDRESFYLEIPAWCLLEDV